VISRVPRSFLEGTRRTYVSSVFFGRLDAALRSLAAAEQERIASIAALLRAGSAEFIARPHFFAESLVRQEVGAIEEALTQAASWNPAEVTLDFAAPVLEAYVDLVQADYEPNPFEAWIEPVERLIAENIQKDPMSFQALVFLGEGAADTEFNIRLGLALDGFGRLAGRDEWAALGRSLVLTVLAFSDSGGAIPSALILTGNGFARTGEGRISGARVYRAMRQDNYPRTVRIGGGINGWAWTAASAVDVTQNGDITDIAVSFFPGETHYLILRGLKPFTKIQLYGIDYRTDPQFERYDSSGWAYSSSEQSLLLKIKHREQVEHIVIYTAPPPPPSPPPPPRPVEQTETALVEPAGGPAIP
jgi:hypothetical protein